MASWNIRVDGKEYGPYADGEIRAFAREGRIQPNTELKRLPDGAWVEAGMITGLRFPELVSSSPTPETSHIEGEGSDDTPSVATQGNSSVAIPLLVFAISLVFFCGFVSILFFTILKIGTTQSEPTYTDLMQVLVDDVDANLGANVFGKASVEDGHAEVVLEADFFNRMDASVQSLTLQQLCDVWFRETPGRSITFRNRDGAVVRKFVK